MKCERQEVVQATMLITYFETMQDAMEMPDIFMGMARVFGTATSDACLKKRDMLFATALCFTKT
jgi:hypothetical protein